MEGLIEIFQTREFYFFIKSPCALCISRDNGKVTVKPSANLAELNDAVSLGSVEGILGKLQCSSGDSWHLLLLSGSEFICSLHDGIEVRRISKILILPISMSPLPKAFHINTLQKNLENNAQLLNSQERPQSAKQQALVQAVQNTIKAASDMMNLRQKPKGSKRFEMRILEELEKLFEGESDQFYFAKHGGDLTLWTQRRESRRIRGELCHWEDLKSTPRTYWRPIWFRYDDSFVWNHRILQDLVDPALEFLKNIEGLPKCVVDPKPPSPTYMEDMKKEVGLNESISRDDISPVEGAGNRTHLTECLCALESMLLPVISGFVKQDKLSLPFWDVDGLISSNKSDTVTLTIISRRSQFRAGCRYRRRGVDERGHVANYVETEQVLEVPGEVNSHILSFLQIRGSVPVFWTQTGIKYKPPIQLHKSLSENRDAFRLHIERPLRKFDRLVVVNLVETTPGRQESKITEAFVRQLLLLNNPRVTYVGFDFHDYCKGLRFGNVAVLLDGVRNIICDMKYCWLHKDVFMCKQEGVFRVNCVDCLDRTNLVQSVFATAVIDSQLRKLGRLPPEVELPTAFTRAVQAVWADNGDALSKHYTGTAAMKGDYTRTGSRTVNGLMKDGVFSMSRYYQRFGEIKRQAAIDFLLGHINSPELRFLQNCNAPDVAVQELPSIEASSLLAAIRSTCLQSDEESFFEFVASTAVSQPRRAESRAFGILTTKFLHIVRFVDDLLTNQQAHLRIPIQSMNQISLATETSLFKQPSPVLHIYFKAPKENFSQKSIFSFKQANRKDAGEWRSSDDASIESAVSTPPVAFKQSQRSISGQYRLDLRQAPFRLFNNYLVPITSVEEATDTLRAVAESITTLYHSIDPGRDLEVLTLPEIRSPGLSVMQRQVASVLPTEYTRPLDKNVFSALQQRRNSLQAFLTPSRLPRRIRRAKAIPADEQSRGSESSGQRFWFFGSSTASNISPSSPTLLKQETQTPDSQNIKGIKRSFGRIFKNSTPLMERVFSNTAGPVKQNETLISQVNGSYDKSGTEEHHFAKDFERNTKIVSAIDEVVGRKHSKEIPVKLAVMTEPFEEVGNDGESNTSDDSSSLEQDINVLVYSDIDDMPAHTIKPTRYASFADLLHELEDAAAITAEDEEEREDIDPYEFSVERTPKSAIILNHEISFSSKMVGVEVDRNIFSQPLKAAAPIYAPDLDTPVSDCQTSSLLLSRTPVRDSCSHSSLYPSNHGKSSRIAGEESRPASIWGDILLQPRSLSCGDRIRAHNLVPPKRSISAPLIFYYREISDPKDVQRMLMPSKVKKSSLKEQLNQHFHIFTMPTISWSQELANPPRFVARLLQRQMENAAAVNRERNLTCSPNDVIKTKFIVF